MIISETPHIQDNQSATRTGSFQTRNSKSIIKRSSVAVDKPSTNHVISPCWWTLP